MLWPHRNSVGYFFEIQSFPSPWGRRVRVPWGVTEFDPVGSGLNTAWQSNHTSFTGEAVSMFELQPTERGRKQHEKTLRIIAMAPLRLPMLYSCFFHYVTYSCKPVPVSQRSISSPDWIPTQSFRVSLILCGVFLYHGFLCSSNHPWLAIPHCMFLSYFHNHLSSHVTS